MVLLWQCCLIQRSLVHVKLSQYEAHTNRLEAEESKHYY